MYAVDSQQTKLIRRMVPHFEHRLFLSATPHNGYPESYTALLELIDNQKFARGVDPDKQSRDETVVRRLKVNVTNPDGTPRFRIRQTREIPVEYTELEREVHGLLGSFADLRKRRMAPKARGGRRAADLVTLLLKKRLFSSPPPSCTPSRSTSPTWTTRRAARALPPPKSRTGWTTSPTSPPNSTTLASPTRRTTPSPAPRASPRRRTARS